MEVLHLAAIQFLQPMGTGRTRPVLLGAEDSNGKLVEVVVKLRGPENHVFYPVLRGGRLDLGPFETKLASLSDEVINGLLEPVPAVGVYWGQFRGLFGLINPD